MKALTLWRPWPVLIGHGIKRVENRPWAPGGRLVVGERFAIHAGKTWDDGCSHLALNRGINLVDFGDEVAIRSAIVAVVTYRGAVKESTDPWFFGPWGWLLDEPVRLPRPVPCKGMQGLWAMPADVASAVEAQLPMAAATTTARNT